jgi:hypothetical protein
VWGGASSLYLTILVDTPEKIFIFCKGEGERKCKISANYSLNPVQQN